jgi:hypothetical protein
MSKFKVNDWVLDDEDNLFQVTRVRDDEISLTDEPYYVLAKDFRLAIKDGDWCWFNMKIDYEWQSPILMRYGEQDMSMWSIEPFVGNLPSFLQH